MSQFVLVSHHKCASSWLARVFEHIRLRGGVSLSVVNDRQRARRHTKVVLYANGDYRYIPQDFDYRGIHVIRDPRDLIISGYWSHLLTHALDGWPQLEKHREQLQALPFVEGLLHDMRFMEREDWHDTAPPPLRAIKHWNYNDARFRTVRMEDLVRDPAYYLLQVFPATWRRLLFPALKANTFEKLAGHAPGQIDKQNHFRNGLPGEWRQLPPWLHKRIRRRYRRVIDRFYPD